jgi:hypothetical protein
MGRGVHAGGRMCLRVIKPGQVLKIRVPLRGIDSEERKDGLQDPASNRTPSHSHVLYLLHIFCRLIAFDTLP